MFHADHEHNEECGHDEETHKRIAKKMDAFIEDVAEDLFTEKDLANLYIIIKNKLRQEGSSASLSYLKAFNAGFEFGIFATQQHDNSIQIIAGMKRVARLKQDEIKALAAKALEQQDERNDN